jgi:hypothetical protein
MLLQMPVQARQPDAWDRLMLPSAQQVNCMDAGFFMGLRSPKPLRRLVCSTAAQVETSEIDKLAAEVSTRMKEKAQTPGWRFQDWAEDRRREETLSIPGAKVRTMAIQHCERQQLVEASVSSVPLGAVTVHSMTLLIEWGVACEAAADGARTPQSAQ